MANPAVRRGAMTDKTSKTIRDLERLLRQEFGFSSRRSKAGAAEAWKALTNIEAPEPDEQHTAAEFFVDLPNLITAKLIKAGKSAKANLQLICKCEKALGLMRSALAEIDESGGPGDVGAHLSLAIHRLEEAIVEVESGQRLASGI